MPGAEKAPLFRCPPAFRLRRLALAWCALAAVALGVGLILEGWEQRPPAVLWSLRALGLGLAGLLLLEPATGVLGRLRRWLDRPGRLMLVLAPLALLDLSLPLALRDYPWTTPDSWEFLGFAPWRTLGYSVLVRLAAMPGPWPELLVWLQVAGTVAAILYFVHALRQAIGDSVAAAVAGLFLLASWPMFIYGFHLLSEQPFLICILLHFAIAARAFRDPRPAVLWGLVATAMVAVSLRPAAHFMMLAVPLLLILRPLLWRRVLLHAAVPMVLAALGLSALHQQALGFFGLSSFAGATLSSNMLYLAQPGTASSDPELMALFVQHAEAYRHSLAPLLDGRERFDEVRRAAAPLTSWAIQTVARRLPPGGPQTEARMEAALAAAAVLSPLNARYSEATRARRPTWPWGAAMPVWQEVNARLTRAALEVFAHDPAATLSFTGWKLAWGWREVLPMFSMRRNLGPNEYVALDRPDRAYLLVQEPDWFDRGAVAVLSHVHDWIAALPFALSLALPLPLIVLAAGLAAPLACARALLSRRAIPAPWAWVAYAGLCLFAYHLEVAFAQIGLVRFLTAGLPLAVILLVAPLTLLGRAAPPTAPATSPDRSG